MPLDHAKVESTLAKIYALRKYTEQTRFRTTRSQHELLAQLNGEETAFVVQTLLETPSR